MKILTRDNIQNFLFSCTASLVLYLALSAAGCMEKTFPDFTAPTGNAIARAQAYNEIADKVADRGAKSSTGSQKHDFNLVRAILGDQAYTLADALANNARQAESFREIQAALESQRKEFDQLYNSWGAWLERLVRRILFWICVYFVIAFGLRIASMFIGGPVGSVMALVSTGMFGPLAWIQSAFDNAYFRKLVPAARGK